MHLLSVFRVFAFLMILPAGVSYAEEEIVRIGVLAKRGPEICLQRWTPTAEYLSREIPGKAFEIVPVDFERIHGVVEKGLVDFILANPSFYVALERKFGVNRMATLKNRRLNGVYTTFGGVIFTRKDRTLRELADLSGRRFMAVKETSFGGWRMAWRELTEAGIDPRSDFSSLSFGGTHDAVVMAVKEGRVDAGTVRSDTLERMDMEKKISLDDFHVIHQHGGGRVHMPFVHSTREYPEWPFARVAHTPVHLAERVALKLLEMPPYSHAALAADCAGWTIPLNYQTVHECLRTLKLEPYEDFGKISAGAVIRKFWALIALVAISFMAMALSVCVFLRSNRNIKASKRDLEKEVLERERLYGEVEEKNAELQRALSELKTLRGILPICSNCKKVKDDKGFWNRIEAYIETHSSAEFTHGICPDCAKALYPDIPIYEE